MRGISGIDLASADCVIYLNENRSDQFISDLMKGLSDVDNLMIKIMRAVENAANWRAAMSIFVKFVTQVRDRRVFFSDRAIDKLEGLREGEKLEIDTSSSAQSVDERTEKEFISDLESELAY